MKINLSFFLFLIPTICFSQSKLAGYVTEQNSGKKPLANVVIASAGANKIVSKDNGKFILTFQGLEAGENVVIRPEKQGWELVNEKEMKTLIPAKPDESPLEIILCKAGTLAAAKKEYYKVADPYIQQQYELKLKALNKEKTDYQSEKNKLREDKDRLQKQLDEMAEEFIRVNLDDANEVERKAIKLFKAGKIDESIQLRESLKSGIEYKNAVARKAKEDSIITFHIGNLKKLASDYLLQFDFKKAEKTYQELADGDTTNFENTSEFAYFLQQQNQYNKAIQYYQRALKLAKKEDETARVQNNLGILYKDKNDYPSALNAYSKALEIYELLTKTNAATYEPGMAMTQNNLGILYQSKNDYDAALHAYNKALEIKERLAKINPATYEPGVAMTQNNLGVLYKAKNDYPAALDAYSKALEISERLAKINPATYEPDVAANQNNLGVLYQAKNDYPSALKAFLKALEIIERLAKTNPDTYEPDVAMTQNNLGILYQDKNDYPAALNAYTVALEIKERLAKTNPATYEPDVAMIQNNLGTLYKDKNDYPAALNAYSKALEISERLAKINPATYEPDVALTQNNLGNLYKNKNDYPAALNVYKKALEIRERLAKINPGTYEPGVADTQNSLGVLYENKNDYPAALKALSRALEIRERLAKTNPDTYGPDLAATQNNLGILYQDKNDYPAALNAHSKALEIYERLAKINPGGYEVKFCSSIVLLALLQKEDYQENRQIETGQYLKKAQLILLKYKEVSLAKTLLEETNDLDIYFQDRKILLPIDAMEIELEKTENFKEKIKIQKNIIEQYRSLVSAGHKNFAYDLGAGLGNLAWDNLFEQQFSAAENAAREALNPTNYVKTEGYDEKIEWANTNLALALLFQGKYTEAEKIYQAFKDKPYGKGTYKDAFLEDLDELEKAGITHPDVAKIRALLKK